MLALLCAAAVVPFQVPVGQPPRLRTLLPNGATVLVERIPGARSLAIGLFASSRSAPETPETHGFRHLLEHLVASGQSGDLDRRLESGGGFLRARTLRDAIAFEMSLPPGAMALGMDATRDILAARIKSAELVKREIAVLEEEGALREPVSRASELAWRRVYGNGGLDPFGSLDKVALATPPSLEKLRKNTFVGSNLVMVIAGDVDLDAATKAASEALNGVPIIKRADPTRRMPDPTEIATAVGGAYRALPVRGYRYPGTAAALSACLAVGSDLDRPVVVYTPSGAPGLVLVGTPDGEAALNKVLADAEPAVLFARGRELARRWVRSRLQDPEQVVAFRGLLLAEAVDLRPETLLENIDTMSYSAFVTALEGLRSSSAIRIGGAS